MSVIVSLMGGLGFFLYGMKLMSEGLQKVAGSKMRSILEVFTKNRVIGLLVGIFFTALIQSSNATTVMVVSFVNSGLMKLAQAPGIILGANIGTTVTGQLIAFDLADIAPVFVIIGVLLEEKDKISFDSFLQTHKINYPIALGEGNYLLAKSIGGVSALPVMILYASDGRLINHYLGVIPQEMLDIDIQKAIM